MEAKQLEKELTVLANSLGLGKLVSYAKLYKTVINTFGQRGSSMWALTISLNVNDQVCGVEVNKTYFADTKQTTFINEVCSFNNPMNISDLTELVKDLK